AASTGIRLGGNALPLAFQSSISESRPFLDSVLFVPVSRGLGECSSSATCRLLDALDHPADSYRKRLNSARIKLQARLEVTRDERSRIISIAFADADSLVAREVVTSAVSVLDRINKTLA